MLLIGLVNGNDDNDDDDVVTEPDAVSDCSAMRWEFMMLDVDFVLFNSHPSSINFILYQIERDHKNKWFSPLFFSTLLYYAVLWCAVRC